ncbi:SRPBCC family protein [Cyanobacterium aponinum FACHB-4101]|uniref:SRPBCC family protein n=1 Tax=Cyanobacterium aponinum TaxID=379064 RepID=UPI00168060BB|nr:SRPBCC family protein [Cyanobacterium aponinum]MBD2393689.1 SRPBCC family protein [Cyanobacterium aponinum FACHB-4101]
MLNFKYSSVINAPIDKVWHFHEREDILQILTPPWQPVKVIRREGGLEVGATSEFVLMFGFINIPWIARHSQYEKYKQFTDEQIKGPMVSWTHYHQFQTEGGNTLLTDKIEYEIPGGWLSEICLGWWVNSRLHDMFAYRHRVTKQHCET